MRQTTRIGRALKVCFLSPALPEPDPGDAVGAYVRRLAADHGLQVTLALTDPPAGGTPSRLGSARAMPISEALAERFDVAMSTTWQATVRLFEVDAARHASFVERLAHGRMSAWQPERIVAAISYDLPVDFLAASELVAGELAQLRPDARCLLVHSGVAKDVFVPGPGGGGGPLRVAATTSEAANAAVGAMTEPHEVEILEAGASARAAGLAGSDVALVLDDERAAREAMHAGAACVATIEGLVAHDVDGLVTAPDDAATAGRALDLLARDRALLERLRAGALRSAQDCPTIDEATAAMARALELLVAEPPGEAARWPVRLMADATAAAALFHNELHAYAQELERVRGDEAYMLASRARELLERPPYAGARRLLRAARRRIG
ncbi:MAG: hypothetical protein QOJ63_382 [Solirubrobacteraceae bacterium]|nr:hypothetical protein [Solirubrobacteraceae bacterium]